MFVTPQHQVKELRNEAGRNIVGGTMLCSELGRMDVGRYIEKGQRGEERREEQEEGEKGRERGGRRYAYGTSVYTLLEYQIRYVYYT